MGLRTWCILRLASQGLRRERSSSPARPASQSREPRRFSFGEMLQCQASSSSLRRGVGAMVGVPVADVLVAVAAVVAVGVPLVGDAVAAITVGVGVAVALGVDVKVTQVVVPSHAAFRMKVQSAGHTPSGLEVWQLGPAH
jgi:hypothetical protein